MKRLTIGPTLGLSAGSFLAGCGGGGGDRTARTLLMSEVLDTNPVYTTPTTCPAGQAVSTPIPTNESWHHSVGHWVEDDPLVGAGAFSSLGAFGFYPWVDASKAWYGVVARKDSAGGVDSVYCRRLIRKGWVTGVAQ